MTVSVMELERFIKDRQNITKIAKSKSLLFSSVIIIDAESKQVSGKLWASLIIKEACIKEA